MGTHWGIEAVAGVNFKEWNTKDLMKSFLFNKPKCFEYEREYRFVSDRKEGLIEYQQDSLVEIILGSKIKSTALKNMFIETAKQVNSEIIISHAKTKENSFEISLEPYK